MAFQNIPEIFAILQTGIKSSSMAESASCENFILDERLNRERENELIGFAVKQLEEMHLDDWNQLYWDFAAQRIRFPDSKIPTTFEKMNAENWLDQLQPDWDVIRVETLESLCDRARDSFLGHDAVETLITKYLDAGISDQERATVEESLSDWLGKVNEKSDSRPTFVAPFGEFEDVLEQVEWANRIRDALGLGHIQPRGNQPRKIVLFQYSLERVFKKYDGKIAWAASPTVLDDGSGSNPCFFPTPRSSFDDEYGKTVDLASPGEFWSEFLHPNVEYQLKDIRKLGMVTTSITDEMIKTARQGHMQKLEDELMFIDDLA